MTKKGKIIAIASGVIVLVVATIFIAKAGKSKKIKPKPQRQPLPNQEGNTTTDNTSGGWTQQPIEDSTMDSYTNANGYEYIPYAAYGKKETPSNTNTNTNTSSPSPTTPSNFNRWEKYTVATQSGNLNVRSTASASGSIVTSLSKGASVWARPSSTSGWYEYSSNGINRTGYVSSDYLK